MTKAIGTPRETRGRGDSNEHADLARRIGSEVLGPVVHRWLLALDQYQQFFDDGDTAFLYCARAGVRIKRLHDVYAAGRSGVRRVPGQIFWVSRLSACKGTFELAPKRVLEMLAQEYQGVPVSSVIVGLLRHHPERLAPLDLDRAEHKAHTHVLPGWFDGPTPEASTLRDYLAECGEAFQSYLRRLLGGKKRAILIDSGWQGSTQNLLADAFPEIDWRGVYFGRSFLPGRSHANADRMIGTMFERDSFDPAVPESAVVVHRHLVESLLEPNAPSIEEIPASPFEAVAQGMIDACMEDPIDDDADRLFRCVEAYVKENAALPVGEVLRRHQAVQGEFSRLLVHPTRDEAIALTLDAKRRSADFGKSLQVPILRSTNDTLLTDADSRIEQALWIQGQIALEFPPSDVVRELQARATGLLDAATYFDPQASGPSQEIVDPERRPLVAIVTRTKNRPVLLRRAAESVAAQTFDNYVWVVVNDGGDEGVVQGILRGSLVDPRKTLLVSNSRSLGMEAASNVGIRSTSSDYVVIHDDDDSWHPEFLERTVHHLEGPGGSRYGGVITKTLYVSEEIRGDRVIEHHRSPYNDWVRNVPFAEMACGNMFAPIAFLYRREIWERVGGYNERLPVLGDWFFNLEFLLQADIGVLHVPLACYHHRDRGHLSRGGIYSNSVIGGVSKHEEFAAIMRNEFLRKHADHVPAATAMMIAHATTSVRDTMRDVSSRIGRPDAAEKGGSATEPKTSLRAAIHDFDRLWLVAGVNAAVAQRALETGQAPAVLPLNASRDAGLQLAAEWQVRDFLEVPDNFDEKAYRLTYPDVAAAVEAGHFTNGYEHYLIFGWREGRERFIR